MSVMFQGKLLFKREETVSVYRLNMTEWPQIWDVFWTCFQSRARWWT